MGSMMFAQSDSRQPCTILLPLFNGANFLGRSIDNLCKIAGPQDEILIIDDGSTDTTKQEIEALCKLDTRIIVHCCQHRGLVETLNFGIQNASHEFIARADIDDTYDYKRISAQVQYLANHPEISAVFSDYKMVNLSGRNLGFFPTAISPELTAFSLINSQRTAHPSVMYRKSAVIAAGSYSAEDFPAEDLALWIRLVGKGKIASLPEILLNYTLHSASITQSKQGLMRTKSLDLRKVFALRPENLVTLNKTQDLLQQYKKFPGRNLRVLFFLEDLITFNRFTEGQHQKRVATIFARQLLSRNVCLLPPVLYVLLMKLKRKLN
jgi:glycosyltransferase involved in cell wall biosynthesis